MTAARLHHEVEGPADGPVLLVLGPSLGTAAAMWEPLVPALAERHRVIRFDPRGHGRSEVPPGPYPIDELAGDVVALLDKLGVRRFAYCGLSMSGATGLSLALHCPDRRDALHRVQTPTLVLAGAEDPAVPLERAKQLGDGIPGADLVVLPDAAHLAPLQHPGTAGAAIVEHLERARGAA